ncbi:MAG: exonuclease SbcCD subunit D [Dehalococcoidia bacterium]|nr:exonuclease SbcCD subunit D [Dehalococcoidia bacterium]MDW8119058.1 exonuclease SbcCD subunit D [Chloroflexota bacterium]
MRLLHFSDLHIGVESYGREAREGDLAALPDYFLVPPGHDRTYYRGANTRLLDFLAAFDAVVHTAITEKVDLVVFAGDAYKSRNPDQTHQREFARRIAHLVNHDIPVLLVAGNHDLPSIAFRASALEIFPTLNIRKVTVSERAEVLTLQTRSGPLQVLTVPWIRPHLLLERQESQGKSPEALRQMAEERLTAHIHTLAQRLDPSLPAILVGHLTLSTATTSTEQSMLLGNDHVLQPSSIVLPGLDYLALGHVHRHQSWGEAPPVVYSGSLQRVDFSEEKDRKGFVVVDIDPGKPAGQRARWEFREVPARPFLTVQVEIGPDDDPTTQALSALRRTALKGAVVRLRLRMPLALGGRLDERALRQALEPAFYSVMQREYTDRHLQLSGRAIDPRASPEEALRKFLEQERLPDTVRQRALALGRQVLTDVRASDTTGP